MSGGGNGAGRVEGRGRAGRRERGPWAPRPRGEVGAEGTQPGELSPRLLPEGPDRSPGSRLVSLPARVGAGPWAVTHVVSDGASLLPDGFRSLMGHSRQMFVPGCASGRFPLHCLGRGVLEFWNLPIHVFCQIWDFFHPLFL